ncbi:MAG: hypothetical protein WCJ30_21910, partial [Deltaproteobacteria bacterium]
HLRATDRGGGLTAMRVLVNGHPGGAGQDAVIAGAPEASHGGVVARDVTVALEPGTNRVEAEAINALGHVRSARLGATIERARPAPVRGEDAHHSTMRGSTQEGPVQRPVPRVGSLGG